MRITTSIHEHELPAVMDWLGGQIGHALSKRVADLKKQMERNPFLRFHFEKAYELELALEHIRQFRRVRNQLPPIGQCARAYAFSATLQRVYGQLGTADRSKLCGNLRGALQNSDGLRSLDYELQVFTYFMRQGCDVVWIDLSDQGQFYFLVKKDQIEFEVECKSTSNVTGRKVHMSDLVRLGQNIRIKTEKLLKNGQLNLFFIEISGRLGTRDSEITNIVDAVVSSITSDGAVDIDGVSIRYQSVSPFSISLSEITGEHLKAVFQNEFHQQSENILFRGIKSGGSVSVMVKSKLPDDVERRMAQIIKKGTEQCSATRPAIIMIQLDSDVSEKNMRQMVCTQSGLYRIVHSVLQGEKRNHVNAIVFTGPSGIRPSPIIGVTGTDGYSAIIRNPKPKFPSEIIEKIIDGQI